MNMNMAANWNVDVLFEVYQEQSDHQSPMLSMLVKIGLMGI